MHHLAHRLECMFRQLFFVFFNKAPEEKAGEVPGEAAPPVPVEAPKPVEAPGKAPVAWIIAAIVVILGIVLIVAYQKQKKKV